MRFIRLSAVITILLTSVSCARSGRPGADEPAPGVISSTVVGRPHPDASGLPPAMRPNVATPDARVADLRAVRWDRAAAGAGRALQVHYTISGRGDCAALGRVDVAETPQEVTVTVLLGRLPQADCDGPQPQLAASMQTVVTLAEPLGTRTVRDGAAG